MENEEAFFIRYMTDVPGVPQTPAMAVGSAFDACIKAYLIQWCSSGGPEGPGPDPVKHHDLYEEFLQDCVEEHCINDARWQGIVVFNKFKETGALKYLLNDLQDSQCEVLGKIQRVIEGVPLLGKPDLSYISKAQGCKVTDDWKCNGALSKRAVSPLPGYVDLFPSRDMHKKCDLVNGVNVLDMHKDYRLQMICYKLLTDCDIVGITQLVFGSSDPSGPDPSSPGFVIGDCRVALHRHRVSEEAQRAVIDEMKELWQMVIDYYDHPERGFGQISGSRCNQLCEQAAVMVDDSKRMLFGR